MASAGGLYVEIIPTFAGGFQAIQEQLVGPAGSAGSEAGARMGQALVSGASGAGAEVGRSIATEVVTSTAGAGAEIGQALTTELVSRTQAGAAAAGEALRTGLVSGATTAGTEAGTAIRNGVAAGAEQGATAAKTALVAGSEAAGNEAGASAGNWFTRAFSLSSTSAGKALITDLRAKLDSAATSVSQAEYQLAAAQSAEEKATNAVNLAEQRLLETRVKYQDGTSQVTRAENQLSAAKNASELASNKVALAGNNLTTAQKAQEQATKDLADAQSKTVFSSNSVNAAWNRLVPGAKALTDQVKTLGVLIGVTLAGQMAVDGVKSAADYQSALTRLVTSAGETQANIKLVGDGMLQMAGEVGISAQDLATGMRTVEGAGYHGADGLAVLKASAQGAKTENADLGTVTNAVTDILNDYHLKASDAATVTSQMITAVGEGKTTFQDLSAAMSTVSPVASSAGINIQNLLGVMAEMTSHGVSADEAAQQLANTIRSFESPSSTMSAELGQLGLNATTLSSQLGQKGVAGTLQEVEQAILQHMGPAGTALLSSFNVSTQAADKAQQAFGGLGAGAQKIAQEFMSGQTQGGFGAWSKALKSLDGPQANLLNQWKTLYDQSHGFSNALKSGGGDVQTFDQALQKATGTSSALQTALLTTGENAMSTNADIKGIAGATTEAGNNVKGWADVQSNFNQRLDDFKASAGSLGITLGTALLPVIQNVMGWFSNFMKALSDHSTAASIAAVAIGTLVGAFAGMVIITFIINGVKAFAEATKIATAAQWLWNAAMNANPLVIVGIVLAALVAGVIYAYTHFQWFRDLVQGAWKGIQDAAQWAWNNVLKPVFDGIVTAAKAVGDFFVTIWHGLETAWHAVASAAEWAWTNVLKPTFDAISLGARILGAIIFTVLVTPYVIAWHLLSAAAAWAWTNMIKPAFDAIAAGAKWLWDNGIKPAIDFIVGGWNVLVGAAQWLWNNGIKPALDFIAAGWNRLMNGFQWEYQNILVPVWNALQDAANWLWTNVLKPVFDFMARGWNNLIAGIVWAWQNILKPAWQALGDAANWLWTNVLKPVFDFMARGWDNLIKGIEYIWNFTLKVVFNAVSDAVHAVGSAFDSAINWIKDTWNKLVDITKAPVNFVINTVYNHGIVPTWNAIASVFALGKLDPIPGLATGGALGGGSQWDAVGSGFVTNGPKAIVGEGNPAYPEYVIPTDPMHRDRALGLYGALGHDIGMFAGGGILGTVGSAIGNVASGIGNAAADVFGWLSSIAGDVTGGVNKLFSSVIGSLTGMPAPDGSGGDFATALKDIPQKVIESVIGAAKNLFSSGGGNGSPYTGPIAGGVQQWSGLVLQALAMIGQPATWLSTVLRRMNQESGGNPNAINLWDSNAAAGHPSIGLMQVIGPTFDAYHVPGTSGNIYDPLANIAAGLNYAMHRYGTLGALNQPGGYDSGGYLMPGVTPVYNGTGQPEPVFTSKQWDVLKANINGGTSGSRNTINVYASSERSGTSIAHEIDRHLSRNSRLSFSF